GKIGGYGQEPVPGNVVHPLDDFRDAAPRAGHLARLAEQRDGDVLLLAGDFVLDRDLLRLFRKILDAQALVEKRIVLHVYTQRHIVFYGLADQHQAIRQPVSPAVEIAYRNGDIAISL